MAYNLFVRIGCDHVLTIADVVCLGWDAFGNKGVRCLPDLARRLGSSMCLQQCVGAQQTTGFAPTPATGAMVLSRLTILPPF